MEFSVNSIKVRETYREMGERAKCEKVANRERFKRLSKNVEKIKEQFGEELGQQLVEK